MCHRNPRQPKILQKMIKPQVQIRQIPCSSMSNIYIATISPNSLSHPNSQSTNPPRSPASRKLPARKIGAQPTRLETVDGSLDPLGPLGAEEPALPFLSSTSDQAPTPPRKESTQPRNARPPPAAQYATAPRPASDSAEHDDSTSLPRRTRGPPPVQPAAAGSFRQTQPSVSIEQAAKPSFDITVGDPHKVGDITSSHIVYQVRTKVRRVAMITGDNLLTRPRQPQKHIGNQILLFLADIATFCGSITRYITTIPALWSHHRQKNRLSVDLTRISSSPEGKR